VDLDIIETYYDTVPRASAARVEDVGPFTLFVDDPATGRQLYARPRLGLAADITPGDVRRVLDRQAELGLPRALEWVDQVTPTLLPAVRTALAGRAEPDLCPLLALPEGSALRPTGTSTRVLTADDPDLPMVLGAVSAAFAGRDHVEVKEPGRRAQLVAAGLLVVVATYDSSGAVVGGGSAAPRGAVAELTGIAVIPSARRQGLGTATTTALAGACRDRGVGTVFLSAGSDQAAGIYRSVGFEHIGTACVLEAAGS
jgi:ribosomal protein S18 acetylase RimI-like enzyme